MAAVILAAMAIVTGGEAVGGSQSLVSRAGSQFKLQLTAALAGFYLLLTS
jgi:hypothetical protein